MSGPPLLLVAGYLTLDIICRVDSIPRWDERITAAAVAREHGGMAANAACAAARLGTSVRFFGHADAGALGDGSLAALAAAGVETSGVRRDQEGGSICVILVGPDGSRMIVSEPLRFDWAAFDAALAEGAAAFHVDGYRLAEALPRAAAARIRGIGASVDLDGLDAPTWDEARAAAAAFSVVFLNRGVVEELGGTPEAAAEELVAAGADAACVTLGAAGVVAATAGVPPTRIPAVPVAAVDTTGAGDAFAGAFLHRLLGGATPLEAAAFANAAAALSTTAVGARGPVTAAE